MFEICIQEDPYVKFQIWIMFQINKCYCVYVMLYLYLTLMIIHIWCTCVYKTHLYGLVDVEMSQVMLDQSEVSVYFYNTTYNNIAPTL